MRWARKRLSASFVEEIRGLVDHVLCLKLYHSAYDNVGPEVKVSAAAKLCECHYVYTPSKPAPVCTFLFFLGELCLHVSEQKTRFAAAREY